MRSVDDKSPRGSGFTHFFSPTHHHEHTLRKRAQSLHAQSTRRNSILQIDNTTIKLNSYQPHQETLDRKSILKLSISAPVPSSSPSRLPHAQSISLPTPQTSFLETRHHENPPNTSERRVQFVEPDSLPPGVRVRTHSHSPSLREPSRVRVHTKKRTVARVSISSGQIYYIEEPIPEYPFPSTCFSPPPPPARSRPRSHSHSHSHSHSRSLSFRRTSSQTTNRHSRKSNTTHLSHCGDDSVDQSGGASTTATTGSASSDDNLPLYTSTSEKFHASWGTFAFNVRFGMFRAQDRMKDGVAWMGGVVRRIKTGR